MSAIEAAIDLLLGMVAGTYGTLIGAGGGFILSPALLLLFDKAPQVAAATSLTAVVFNAATAVLIYHRQGRIDYYTGLRFALATVPGALLGVYLAPHVPADLFKAFFGVLLLLIAAYLGVRGARPPGLIDEAQLRAEGKTVRRLVDASGTRAIYGYRLRDGLLLSAGVGLLSSLLGVGGGIIHTPAMIALFGVPVHVAVATSQFILLVSALTGALAYLAQGLVDMPTALALGLGAVAGARLGATLARRVKGKLIIRLLALALALVGLRLLLAGLGPVASGWWPGASG